MCGHVIASKKPSGDKIMGIIGGLIVLGGVVWGLKTFAAKQVEEEEACIAHLRALVKAAAHTETFVTSSDRLNGTAEREVSAPAEFATEFAKPLPHYRGESEALRVRFTSAYRDTIAALRAHGAADPAVIKWADNMEKALVAAKL